MKKQTEEIMLWIREISQSDSQVAFESLYLTYFERLLRFIILYVHSLSEAEEIVSDTFLVLWNNRKALPEITNFDSYLYAIARHKAISHYRIQHMTKVDLNDKTVDFFIHTETTPEEELISKETKQRLNDAINALPYKCKMTFKLVREDKLKYKEVAAILDISVKTVEAHLATAIKKIRKFLSSEM